MTPDEYGQMLSETDALIDRLHALYEQWFQGVERREPLKQREIIQRRLDGLRTSMPRNTALRFRTQNMIQRWVTMTHHWTKIARQIEEGTYRRDVLRAKRRLEQLKADDARKQTRDPKTADARTNPDKPNALEGWDLDVDAVDDAFDRAFDEPTGAAPPNVPRAPGPPGPPTTPKAPSAPIAASDPVAPSEPAPVYVPKTFGDEGAAVVVGPRFTGGVPVTVPNAVPPPTAVGRPAAPAGPARPGAPAAPAAPSAPRPAAVAAQAPAPGPPPPPPPVAAARPPPAPPALPPLGSTAARSGPKVPPPPLPPPVTAARPAPPAPPAPPAGPDVRGLYDKYIEARRQNNERVDNVKFESVAASIEKMIPELQSRHQGKKIDFEVVLKDGRVGIKPVPK